jgi:hypothetical protein
VGGRITRLGTMGRQIDKLLANPHTALCKETRWHILQVDAERQCYNLGEQWWDPAIKSNPSLTSQHPLLDGGEGKSITSNKNKISIPVNRKDHEAQVDGVQEDMVSDDKGDTPPESTSLQGIRDLSPCIILTGALAHMATTEEAVTDTTFTPCSLLR